ncbi:MAG: DUF3365 domain-containing protein [Candidatus Methylomirabilales bacterium]
MRRTVRAVGLLLFVASVGLLAAIVLSRPETSSGPGPEPMTYADKRGDQELAYLLVKLELKTRAVIGGHYTRAQSPLPGIDTIYKRWLAKNTILPAAVADRVFAEVVPGATGGRAWVKMVVEEPRNPHNRGDPIALELFREIQDGDPSTDRSTPEAYYYAEPIKATQTCLPCHGEPRGEPDPLFPQYKKNGWRDGQIVGAVVARVAPEK